MRGFRQNENNHNAHLWIVPLKMSLAAVVLFAITLTLDTLAACQTASDNLAVSIRLLSTLGRLGVKMEHHDQLRALHEQANAVWETSSSKMSVQMDRNDLETAWHHTQAALTEASGKLVLTALAPPEVVASAA